MKFINSLNKSLYISGIINTYDESDSGHALSFNIEGITKYCFTDKDLIINDTSDEVSVQLIKYSIFH